MTVAELIKVLQEGIGEKWKAEEELHVAGEGSVLAEVGRNQFGEIILLDNWED